MIRRLVPLVLPMLLAFLFFSDRAGACSRADYDVAPSEPQAVAAAKRVVLARAVATDEAKNLEIFTVEEVLRGEDEGPDLVLPGMTSTCDPMTLHEPGKFYLLYLDPIKNVDPIARGKGWRLSSLYNDEFPVDRPVAGPDDPLVHRVREYGRIAEQDSGPAAEEALRRLSREAALHPERYPAGLAADLDRHFRFLTPYSPFARLAEQYERAAYPEERLEALTAMTDGRHPETAEFVRRRLASGEDLGQELLPISWFLQRGADPEPRDRELLLQAARYSAVGADVASSAADLARRQGDDRLVLRILRNQPEAVYPFLTAIDPEHLPGPRLRAELARLYHRLPAGEKERLASLLVYLAGQNDPFLVPLVLADADPQGRTARLSGHPEALARAFRAARPEPRRRALLLRLLFGAGDRSAPLILPLLSAAQVGEARLVLSWMNGHLQPGGPVPPVLTAWLAGARSEPEAERALWAAAVSWHGELLVPAARQLAARLPVRGGGSPAVALLGRAALSSPAKTGRYELLRALVQGAGEDDRPLLLDLLRQADANDGEILAGWFVDHPDPAATPALKALLDRPDSRALMPGQYNSAVATALAAAGDREIVARVIALFARRPVELARGLTQVLLSSPLPEAAEAARRLHLQEPAGVEEPSKDIKDCRDNKNTGLASFACLWRSLPSLRSPDVLASTSCRVGSRIYPRTYCMERRRRLKSQDGPPSYEDGGADRKTAVGEERRPPGTPGRPSGKKDGRPELQDGRPGRKTATRPTKIRGRPDKNAAVQPGQDAVQGKTGLSSQNERRPARKTVRMAKTRAVPRKTAAASLAADFQGQRRRWFDPKPGHQTVHRSWRSGNRRRSWWPRGRLPRAALQRGSAPLWRGCPLTGVVSDKSGIMASRSCAVNPVLV